MNQARDGCPLPDAAEKRANPWPWVLSGAGLLLVAAAFVGGPQGGAFLPEPASTGAGIVGLVLLFGGLGSRGGRGRG